MNETLILFETAKLAKEKKFDIPCGQFYCEDILEDDEIIKDNLCQRRDFGIYGIQITDYNFSYEYNGKKVNNKCYSAPTQSFLQKWLREEHNIKVESLFNTLSNDYYINIVYNENNILRRFIGTYKTYEQALEVGLYEALKLIK